jgi:hypothetical protein
MYNHMHTARLCDYFGDSFYETWRPAVFSMHSSERTRNHRDIFSDIREMHTYEGLQET